MESGDQAFLAGAEIHGFLTAAGRSPSLEFFLGFVRLKFLRCYVSPHELDQLVEVLNCEIFYDCNFVK